MTNANQQRNLVAQNAARFFYMPHGSSCNIRNIMHNEVMSKTYNMDDELVDEIVNEMHEGEMMCSIDEIVEACCGNNFYGNWDDEELKYVEEVMREYCQINVEFDLENELMIIASAVDE